MKIILGETITNDMLIYIEGLKDLLRFDRCPEILIENPKLLKGRKATDADLRWAAEVIERYEKQNKLL